MCYQKILDKVITETLKELEKDIIKTSEDFREDTIVNGIARIFFIKWFKEFGSAYYFLFKKNLKITNIQYAELIALLRRHTYNLETNIPMDNLQILGVQEFNNSIREVLRSFYPKFKDSLSYYRNLFNIYSSLLEKTILTDSFYGSCSLFLPPHISINLASVCFYSGYIHSCGRNIFIRNVNKAQKEHFYEALDLYLKQNPPPPNKRYFFAVYAHEDFTQYDRALASDLRDGLDDVKIFVEKYYMGNDRLVSVLNDLKIKYKDYMRISDPGDYRKQHKAIRANEDVLKEKTLWLIIDRAITNNINIPDQKKYYICYEQQFINQNPFHIYDENKPAWISHTTIPHTLAGAMINISVSNCPIQEKIEIHDPFGGAGTIWLELLKYNNVIPYSSDIDKVAKILTKDNIDFFCLPLKELENIGNKLSNFANDPGAALQTPRKIYEGTDLQKAYQWALEILDKILTSSKSDSVSFSTENIEELLSKDIFHRILFYIQIRTVLRHNAEFERSVKNDWTPAFLNETKKILLQIISYIKLRKEAGQGEVSKRKSMSIFLGSYSNVCSFNYTILNEKNNDDFIDKTITIRDATVELKQNSFDVIITDPPYGFNTNEDIESLAKLYDQSLKAMIGSLKNEGQLVLCLPDCSYTGRNSPFITHKEIVIQQIISIAEMNGYEIITSYHTIPEPITLFKPPYYWESERALRRSILHFKLRKK